MRETTALKNLLPSLARVIDLKGFNHRVFKSKFKSAQEAFYMFDTR